MRIRDRARSPRRARAGFTLLELVAALAVLGATVAAVVLGASAALAGVRLRAASVQLFSAFVRAREAAMAEGRTWEVRRVSERVIAVGPSGAIPVEEALPDGTRLASATAGGRVRFAVSGTADNATFVLEGGAEQRRVVVNQRGRVTLE
ncbi:type II secretion system GspH family protein [bacterium]|nr:type II secretion system GspH family protein [bacterium]